MGQKKLSVRRRRWKRFRIKGSAIVILHKPRLLELGKPRYIELGPILDISVGGLAVQYFETKDRLTECTELSITVPDEGIKVEKVNFKTISDVQSAEIPGSKTIRTRRAEFQDLTSYQRFQLESLLKKYGTGIVFDRRSGKERRQFKDPRFDDEDFAAHNERRIFGERREGWPLGR